MKLFKFISIIVLAILIGGCFWYKGKQSEIEEIKEKLNEMDNQSIIEFSFSYIPEEDIAKYFIDGNIVVKKINQNNYIDNNIIDVGKYLIIELNEKDEFRVFNHLLADKIDFVYFQQVYKYYNKFWKVESNEYRDNNLNFQKESILREWNNVKIIDASDKDVFFYDKDNNKFFKLNQKFPYHYSPPKIMMTGSINDTYKICLRKEVDYLDGKILPDGSYDSYTKSSFYDIDFNLSNKNIEIDKKYEIMKKPLDRITREIFFFSECNESIHINKEEVLTYKYEKIESDLPKMFEYENQNLNLDDLKTIVKSNLDLEEYKNLLNVKIENVDVEKMKESFESIGEETYNNNMIKDNIFLMDLKSVLNDDLNYLRYDDSFYNNDLFFHGNDYFKQYNEYDITSLQKENFRVYLYFYDLNKKDIRRININNANELYILKIGNDTNRLKILLVKKSVIKQGYPIYYNVLGYNFTRYNIYELSLDFKEDITKIEKIFSKTIFSINKEGKIDEYYENLE